MSRPAIFGPSREWPAQDLIGLSDDLDPEIAVWAYRCGVFPMPLHDSWFPATMGWWSPMQRGVLLPDGMRVTRSLRKSARRFRTTVDADFAAVLARCADPSRPHGWIDAAIVETFTELHRRGVAHSIETWTPQGDLAGGLYGIALGGLFAGESMFHDPAFGRDASKVALIRLASVLSADGVTDRLIDVQWRTEHLASLGAIEIDREEYLATIDEALGLPPVDWPAAARKDAECLNCPRSKHCAHFWDGRIVGRTIARTDLLAFSALKTFALPLSAMQGAEVGQVRRWGKFIGIDADGTWLVFHLARAGWLVWKDAVPAKPARPGRGPLTLRMVFEDDSGFDLTEMGTQRKLALYVVSDPQQVPHLAGLGPDPLADEFDSDALAAILAKAGRAQLKGVLRDQRVIAGIGNAYSDEILHAAKLSPFKPSNSLNPEQHERLFRALKDELNDAVARSVGLAAKDLKGEKKIGLRVHGKKGEPCPVCGDTIAEVSFADSSLQYCPTCQTGGKPLADRRLSKLLK